MSSGFTLALPLEESRHSRCMLLDCDGPFQVGMANREPKNSPIDPLPGSALIYSRTSSISRSGWPGAPGVAYFGIEP